MTGAIAAPVPAVRPAPLDRLPGTSDDDPFLRLAAGWLVGHPDKTATAYRRDLESWAAWCARLGVHPLAAERHSALSSFYDYGVHDAQVLTHSPVASVRRPRVVDDSQAVGLTSDELRRLLTTAAAHSPRAAAL